MTSEEKAKKLDNLAWLLDSSIKIPATNWTIGLDGLIGLIPGVGDITAGSISAYILFQAVKIGAPVSVILRMALNIMLESVVGVIPIVGDLFDFAFKANRRNVDLMREYVLNPESTSNRSLFTVLFVVLAVLGIAGMLVWGMFALLSAVFGAIF